MISDNQPLLNWLLRIETFHSNDICLGLDRVLEVGNKLNLFHFECPVVMIAGTNGKGSTLATLAKLLECSNKRYGTYTSPHLLHFNERIRLNGEMISDEALCEAFSQIESASQGIALTYFEFTTLAALLIFQKAELDYLLLEIGMGGRLDAVNAVKPDLAVLTSISYDHEAWLGNTLSEIAKEKAGILREKIPVVLSHEACQQSVLEATRQLENSVIVENEAFGFLDSQRWFYKFDRQLIDVPKNYLPINSVSLGLAAYTILKGKDATLPSLSCAVKNLENTGMIGRCHPVMVNSRRVVFDVAHNPSGGQWLTQKMKQVPKKRMRLGVWSSLTDKALVNLVQPLCENIDMWYIASLAGPRAASLNELREALKAHAVHNIREFETIDEAFWGAMQDSTQEDDILVFGSFYTVAECYKAAKLGNITQLNNGLFYSE